MIRLGPLRDRYALARNAIGRAATAAGAGALAVGTFAPDTYATSMTTAVLAAGWGTAWSATLPKGRTHDASMALYLSPSLSMAVLLTAQRLASGIPWWAELLTDATWTGLVWKVRPARMARVFAGREPSLTPEAVEKGTALLTAPAPAGPQHRLADFWTASVATEDGAAPHTTLEQIEQTGPHSVRAVIRSARPGKPVPKIDLLELSAALDWPEDEIAITPVPRQGAGVRRLTVGQAPENAEQDPYAHWQQHIAPKGMPGTVITAIRTVTVDDDKELHA